MSESVAWTVACLLVIAGVAAEAYLGWTFIRDWRAARSERTAKRNPPEQDLRQTLAMTRPQPIALVGVAALLTSVCAAAAHADPVPTPAEPPSNQAGGHPATHIEPTNGAVQASNPPTDGNVSSAISVQLNLDFTSAYFYRGIRQQDKGLIAQPAVRITTRVVDDSDLKLDGFIGTWNSVGPNAGTRDDALGEDWYESDLYAGLTLSAGKLSLTTSYTFLTSPSDAFETVEELLFTLALDDSPWLKQWSLKPYATLVFETGSNGSDSPDLDNGVYLELGVAPGFSFGAEKSPITLTFPASIGLSLADYYQSASGRDDTFGFAQVGTKASVPLGEPGRFGSWTLNAGVSLLFLGDHTGGFNRGDDTEVIGTIGVQWNF